MSCNIVTAASQCGPSTTGNKTEASAHAPSNTGEAISELVAIAPHKS